MKKIQTVGVIVENDRILLGMKKRGFGMGRWNGFGGNQELGESIEETMKRELFEEAGIEATEMEEMGIIEFRFSGKPDLIECHFFKILSYNGKPTESEEMKPAWFVLDKIPYDSMWPDDRYWLPMLLKGKKFRGKFTFGDKNSIVKQEIK